MTRVKICGITSLDDALMSADLGADELGFNFYSQSPRFVDVETVKMIGQTLPKHIVKIGVFVNAPLEIVVATAAAARLDRVQLHGSETPEFARSLAKRSGLFLIKAFRVADANDIKSASTFPADAILLDSFSSETFGGSGKCFDWSMAAKVRVHFPSFYLAGGLTPENVSRAIESVSPDYVDVCSGVEKEPGKKDGTKVRAFICGAREQR